MCSNNLKLPIRAAPYRHQREAAAYALDKLINGGGAALLMEMGTGKTLTTIAIVGHLWQEKRVQRLLVVAPLSILGVWEDEFRKFADYDYSLAVLEGTGARKTDTIRHMTGLALQVLVVNYESAWRLEKELAAWRPDMIVCDEGHKIKTHNIAASKALHRLGARVPYRLLLTGTVITNKPIDVFSQYKFADSTVFGSSFYLFRNRYFDMVGYGNYTPVMKKSMEAEFTEKLQHRLSGDKGRMPRPAGMHGHCAAGGTGTCGPARVPAAGEGQLCRPFLRQRDRDQRADKDSAAFAANRWLCGQ